MMVNATNAKESDIMVDVVPARNPATRTRQTSWSVGAATVEATESRNVPPRIQTSKV